MAITNLPGKGTLLALQVSSTYYTIGQRVQLDGPDPELKTRDTTHLDSTMMTVRAAIVDPGTISGTVLYDPNDSTNTVNHPTLQAKVFTPPTTPDQWKLTFADGLTNSANEVFKGYLTKWKKTGMKVDETLQVEFEIKLTDLFTPTAGS